MRYTPRHALNTLIDIFLVQSVVCALYNIYAFMPVENSTQIYILVYFGVFYFKLVGLMIALILAITFQLNSTWAVVSGILTWRVEEKHLETCAGRYSLNSK
ncbi:Hypothetical_protein [Hexamita inflata]|uniref:Hypothetical_protein n=1 Tax=Hexamita inflata TaxID=28002 RepID=A0ABP1HH85_9EUKA